jgi:hypothetical protein
MPIAESTRYKLYEPTVATTTFLVPFPIADTDDLEVAVGGVVTTAYSVTATFSDGFSTDAQVVLLSGTTETVEIYGKRAPRQENEYLASSPDLAAQLEYAADLLTITQQEQQRDVQNAQDAQVAAASAAASASLAAAYDGPNFDTVADLLADTGMTYDDYSAGDIVYVKQGAFAYEIAASGATDHDVATAGGIKLYCKPTFGIWAGATGAVSGSGTDYQAELQKVIDAAVREDSFVNLAGGTWQSDGTLSTNGLKAFFGSGGTLLFPPSGTYERFKEDDGTTDVSSDTTRGALDVSGNALTFVGNITIKGASLSSFKAADRANIDFGLTALFGMTSSVAEIHAAGQVVITGFSYPIYVLENPTANVSTVRQFARITGNWRSRFNLTQLGYFGAASNPFDDSLVNWRSDRCGGFWSGSDEIAESSLTKSTFNFGYLFCRGLARTVDAEPSTVSVDGTTTLTLSAEHDYLQAGDYITVEGAFERASDSTARPLVCKVESVSGTTVTVNSLTAPNLTASGLSWYYKPPRWRVTNSHINCHHMYLEGFWDCIRLLDRGSISANNYKHGGTELSGRQGAVINCTGLTQNLNMTIEATCLESTQVDSCVNFGMTRQTSPVVDASLQATLIVPGRKGEFTDVSVIQGVDPVVYFGTGRASRYAFNMVETNVEIEYTDVSERIYFAGGTGVATRGFEQDGRLTYGEVALSTTAKIATLTKNEELNNSTATTIYSSGTDEGELLAEGVYEIFAAPGDRSYARKGLISLDASGNFTVDEDFADEVTLSASTTNLQATRTTTPSPQTVSFSLRKVL